VGLCSSVCNLAVKYLIVGNFNCVYRLATNDMVVFQFEGKSISFGRDQWISYNLSMFFFVGNEAKFVWWLVDWLKLDILKFRTFEQITANNEWIRSENYLFYCLSCLLLLICYFLQELWLNHVWMGIISKSSADVVVLDGRQHWHPQSVIFWWEHCVC